MMLSNQGLATMFQNGRTVPASVAAALLSEAWMDLTDAVFQEAVQRLLSGYDDFWLKANAEVFIDPETQPGEQMGIHATVAPFLPYRSCVVNGHRIYLFEHHVKDIIK